LNIRRTTSNVRLASIGAGRFLILFQLGPEISAGDHVRLLAPERRPQVLFEEALILLPGAFPRLRVFLDVAVDELVERRSLAVAMLPRCRVIAVPGHLQGLPRLLTRIAVRQDIEPAQRQPTLGAVAAVEDDPGLSTVIRNPEPEAG